jgi:hypothetical protein
MSPRLIRAASADLFPATTERLEAWKADPDVLGVLLMGSKAQGHQDELSDDDLDVLLNDEAFARLAPGDCHDVLIEGEGNFRRIVYDALLTSLSALQAKASSHLDVDHWPYERAQVLFAREDAPVQGAVTAAAHMFPEFRRLRITHGTIDAWVAAHRAVKTVERRQEAAVALLVARGTKALARVLFALESRWTPLDHWLERELATLEDPERVGPSLVAALREKSSAPLLQALTALEDRLAGEGVPRPASRRALFLELIHPSRAEERAIHALP